jgi:hypothetical protein
MTCIAMLWPVAINILGLVGWIETRIALATAITVTTPLVEVMCFIALLLSPPPLHCLAAYSAWQRRVQTDSATFHV